MYARGLIIGGGFFSPCVGPKSDFMLIVYVCVIGG